MNKDIVNEISNKLLKKQKTDLLYLIAETMEKAYRRGVQQTLHFIKEKKIDKKIEDRPDIYRYEKDIKTSFGLDGYTTKTVDRLLMEEPHFHCLKDDNKENIEIENKQEFEYVPLTKWSRHISYPSQGTMRNLVARRRENGAEVFLSLINGRFYVHVKKFNEWMQSNIKKPLA